MKKLMITLSAAVLAFGAFADGAFIAGETFNDKSATTELTGWTGLTEDCAISTTPYTFSQIKSASTPDFNQGEVAGNNLTIKTPFNAPAFYSLDSAHALNTQLYFDSLVKFTACDEAPDAASYAGAKLVVWVKEEESDNTVTKKLMVTAGFLDEEFAPTPQNYDCGDPSDYGVGEDGDWCRLTIKAIKDITDGSQVPGFVVFVNGKAVTIDTPKNIGIDRSDLTGPMGEWRKSNQLFPSLVAKAATITSVGFAGQGAVDDVCFTTAEPTAAKGKQFALDPVPDVAEVTINGAAVPAADAAAINTALAGLGEGDVATIKLTEGDLKLADDMDDGLDIPDVAATVTIDLNGQTLSAGDDCTTAITAGDAVTLIITDSSEEKTGVVDGDVYAKATSIDAGTFEGYVSIGDGSEITGGKFSTEAGNDPETLNQYVDTDTLKKELKDNGEGYLVLTKIVVKHSVIFIVDDSETGRIQYEEGAEIPAPTGPDPASTKAWESFAGWSDGEKIVTFPLTMGENDITLTATFKFLDQDANNNYLIANKEDLNKLAAYVADGQDTTGKVFKQTETIDLEDASVAIGNEADGKAFKGTYDGGNFEISNLVVAPVNKSYWTALFANIDGATIKNLKVSGSTSNTTENPFYRGALVVGIATGNVTMENVTSSGTVTGNHNLGGMFGRFKSGTLNFIACTNHANVTGNYSKLGGLFVYCDTSGGKVNFTDCLNDGAITATGAAATEGAKVGGIACGTWASGVTYTFTRCRNEGAISGTQYVCKNQSNWSVKVGGIAGQLSTATVFEDCTNTGAIYGNSGNVDGGSVSADAEIGGVGGICGQAVSAVTFKGEIASLGTVTSEVKENASRVKCGSLVGNGNGQVEVVAGGAVVTSNQLMPALGSGTCAALNFAVVDEQTSVGTFQAAPTAAGAYVATLPNSAAIKFGTAQGDKLYIVTNVCAYSGEVKTEVASSKVEKTDFAEGGYAGYCYEIVADAPAEDWDKPVTPIVPGETKAADAWPTLKDTPLAQADASKLVAWAKDTTKGNITFDKAAEIKVDAFLLDCANTDEAVTAAKAAFKVTSITQDAEGNWVATVGDAGDGEEYKNGYINIVSYDLEGAGDDAEFFQAKLLLQPAVK